MKEIFDYILSLFKSRIFPLIMVFIVLVGVLVNRLFSLQIINGESYVKDLSSSIQKDMSVAATRGRIFDKNGVLLAYNDLAYAVRISDSGKYEDNDTKNRLLNTSIDKTLTIIEDDYSTYYGWYVTEKQYATWNFYGSSSGLEEKNINSYSAIKYQFNSNGEALRGSSIIETWTTEANKEDTTGKLLVKGSGNSSTKPYYFTKNMIAFKSSSNWNDAYIGIWDKDVILHVLKLNDGETRIAWTEDASKNITDKLLITNNNLYTSFELYTDSTKTTECTGANLTTTSNFYVYVDDETYLKVASANVTKKHDLTITANENSSLKVTNEAGEEITKAENGSTVYIEANANEGYNVKNVKATYKKSNGWYGTTTVEVEVTKTDDGKYSFVMPEYAVTISCEVEQIAAETK